MKAVTTPNLQKAEQAKDSSEDHGFDQFDDMRQSVGDSMLSEKEKEVV